MNNISMPLIGAAIGVLCLCLGFVALILQKTYVSQDTGAILEVDVPAFGRMKTNYPSMAFVVASLVFFLPVLKDGGVDWTADIMMKGDIDSNEFRAGELSINSSICSIASYPDSKRFQIKIRIPSGVDFEDDVNNIFFEHSTLSNFIFPAEERRLSQGGKPTRLIVSDKYHRSYELVANRYPVGSVP